LDTRLTDPLLGALAVGQQSGPGPHQVADRLFGLGGHPDGCQLSGTTQPG